MNHPTVFLKPGREKSLLRGHPWLFSGAVDRIDGAPASGETVAVRDAAGAFLAWAAFSSASSIRLRVWTRDEDAVVDAAFFDAAIRQAIALRKRLGLLDGTAPGCRLVYAESDGIPGLVVDRYGDRLVVQLLTAGVEFWKREIIAVLEEITGIGDIYERSDVEVRKLEGLGAREGVLAGSEPGGAVIFEEDGLRFLADIAGGQKTGFYLDQRDSRRSVRARADGRRVLNAFGYTGAFSVCAAAGGAGEVTTIDSSAAALALAKENLALNGLGGHPSRMIEGDVFAELRTLRDAAQSYDMIILDPPKFAATRRQVEKAARGYKDINLWALKLLRPGGLLITFSCSGSVDAGLFQKIVAGAAEDAGAQVRIIERLGQAADHPEVLHFPEGEYLKGLVLERVN